MTSRRRPRSVITTAAVLAVLAACGGTDTATDPATDSATDSATAPATTSPNDTGGPPTTTAPEDRSFGSFEPATTSGSGRDTVPMPEGASVGMVTATYDGSGLFDVGFVRGRNAFPLISWTAVTGPYDGSVTFGLFDRPQARSLTVWADEGSWEVTIAPLSSAEELPDTVTRTGDAVFRYSGEPTRWVFRKRGTDRLIVIQGVASPASTPPARAWTTVVWGTSETVTLGESGASVVAVSADGRWSATAQ